MPSPGAGSRFFGSLCAAPLASAEEPPDVQECARNKVIPFRDWLVIPADAVKGPAQKEFVWARGFGVLQLFLRA